MTQTTPNNVAPCSDSLKPSLFTSLELSNSKWMLTCGSQPGGRELCFEIAARDRAAFIEKTKLAKERLKLPKDAPVYTCYEAGRDGFWIHRWLTALGITNFVLDPASIEVPRHKHAKSDRLDGSALLRLLFRLVNGDRRSCKVVIVPKEEDEDARRIERELERLKNERTAHTNRIGSLLMLDGVIRTDEDRIPDSYEELQRWNGSPLGANLVEELTREYERLELARKQIRQIELVRLEKIRAVEALMKAKAAREAAGRQAAGCQATAETVVQSGPMKAAREGLVKARQARLCALEEEALKMPEKEYKRLEKVVQLIDLKGIGITSASILINEVFGWRKFRNSKNVSSFAGLTGTPYNSGASRRDQGISKTGSSRIRALLVELSWLWLRYQPDSAITRWFEHFTATSKRVRKVAIIAVARRLLIALWKYVENGEIPAGARLKS